jgi:starvation-inducible DNA-binding protein
MNAREIKSAKSAPAGLPSGFDAEAISNISNALTTLLADYFALYVKTKNFHWHVSGPHFRDYHRLLDEQSDQLIGTTDEAAERVRKIGGVTLHSIRQIARLQRVADNDEAYVPARQMLTELCEDNSHLAGRLRIAHALCDKYGDVASASLIENWIDQAEQRTWFLYEATQADR